MQCLARFRIIRPHFVIELLLAFARNCIANVGHLHCDNFVANWNIGSFVICVLICKTQFFYMIKIRWKQQKKVTSSIIEPKKMGQCKSNKSIWMNRHFVFNLRLLTIKVMCWSSQWVSSEAYLLHLAWYFSVFIYVENFFWSGIWNMQWKWYIL